MRQFTLALALLIPLGLGLAGCDKKDPAPKPKPAGGDHGHDHGEDGHDHGDGKDHTDAHDTEIKIGPIKIGEYTVNVVSFTDLKPGTLGHMDIHVSGGGDIGVVRLWAGDEKATGVAKEMAERTVDEGKFHGHAEIPDPIGDAKLWIEIDDGLGNRVAGSASLVVDHDHKHGDDHDHKDDDHGHDHKDGDHDHEHKEAAGS